MGVVEKVVNGFFLELVESRPLFVGSVILIRESNSEAVFSRSLDTFMVDLVERTIRRIEMGESKFEEIEDEHGSREDPLLPSSSTSQSLNGLLRREPRIVRLENELIILKG